MSLEIDQLQARYIIAQGWLDAATLERAQASRLPSDGADLCAVLLQRGLINRPAFDQIRSATIAARSQSRAYSQFGPATGRGPSTSKRLHREGLDSTLAVDRRRPTGMLSANPSNLVGSHRSPGPRAPRGARRETGVIPGARRETGVITPPTGRVPPSRYQLEKELGRGAMGVVYRARDLETGRSVALKYIQGSAPGSEEIKRFEREALTLVRLKHPHLVEIVDVSFDSPTPYLAMEYVEGPNLRSAVKEYLRLNNRPPPWERLEGAFKNLADALAYCHEQGVIHRDLKPENVVLDSQRDRAVLIDFGLLKEQPVGSSADTPSLGLTSDEQVVGTPAFMSPEQFYPGRQFGDVGPASDVWGFGATMFYVLSGRRPFPHATPLEIAMAIKAGEFPDLKEHEVEAPDWVQKLCADCLRPDARRRPRMNEIRRRLDRKGVTRGARGRGAALVAAVLVLGVGGALAWNQWGPSSRDATLERQRLDSQRTARLARPELEIANRKIGRRIILGEDESLSGRVTGAEKSEVRAGSRRVAVGADGRFTLRSLRLLGSSTLRIAVSAGGRSRTYTVEVWTPDEIERARRSLSDLEIWDREVEGFQNDVIALVDERLGQDYRFCGAERYSFGEARHRIAGFEHRSSGVVLHLIPGGSHRLICLKDPDFTNELSSLGALAAQRLSIERSRKFVDLVLDEPHHRTFFLDLMGVEAERLDPKQRGVIEDYIGALRGESAPPMDSAENRVVLQRVLQICYTRLKRGYGVESEVELKPFFIARTELTRSQARLLTGSGTENSDMPLVRVAASELQLQLRDTGLRLPSRAEWEYACEAGAENPYLWGEGESGIEARSWVAENASSTLHSVSEHEGNGNAFGLTDMIGNVAEWAIEDWDHWRAVLDDSGLPVPLSPNSLDLGLSEEERSGPRPESFADIVSIYRSRCPGLGGDVTIRGALSQGRMAFYRNADARMQTFGARLARDLPELGP